MIEVSDAQLASWIASVFWPLCRIAALFVAAPIWSQRAIPNSVKVGFAVVTAMALVPGLPAPSPATLDPLVAIPIALQQFAVGAIIGFAMRIVFAGVELAGDLVGLQMSFSFSGFVDPQNATHSPLVGSFLSTLAMLVFVSLDGHAQLIAAVARSFELVPVGAIDASLIAPARVAHWGSALFAIGVHLALPMLGALLVCNAALGVLARAAPQLNLLSIGMPATLLVGLIVLTLALPHMGSAITSLIERGFALGAVR